MKVLNYELLLLFWTSEASTLTFVLRHIQNVLTRLGNLFQKLPTRHPSRFMAEKHLFLYNFLGTINNQISRQLNLMFESCQPRSRCILNSDLISAFMLTREEERTFKGKYPERESSKLDSLLVKWMFIQFIKAIVSIEFIIMIFLFPLENETSLPEAVLDPCLFFSSRRCRKRSRQQNTN